MSKIKVVRLGIAQILTVISQNQKKALREAYSGKVRENEQLSFTNCFPIVVFHCTHVIFQQDMILSHRKTVRRISDI